MISALFLLIAVTLNSLDILVHVGEARSLTEYDPSATKWDEENFNFSSSSGFSPLGVWVGVYPDLVPGEVAVSVQVGGTASLHADQVHVIAI